MVAADTLGSYGSMARFPDLNRIMKVQRNRIASIQEVNVQLDHESAASLSDVKIQAVAVQVNDSTILGAGGDYADFQYIGDVIKQKQIDEDCKDDGFNMKPKVMSMMVKL